MKILFQVEVGHRPLEEVLDTTLEAVPIPPEEQEYVDDVIHGVLREQAELDRIIADLASGWKLERIANVDRNILRLALYELRHRADIPPSVSINEAVEIAKKYSTAESGKFVNGILGSYLRSGQMRPAADSSSGKPSTLDPPISTGRRSPSSASRHSVVTLEEQLRILEQCGIRRRPGITIAHLLEQEDRSEYEEEPPFLYTLATLGSEMEDPPYKRYSDDVWTFDVECLDPGSGYAAIAQRMRDLAHGDLPIAAIKEQVDLDEAIAWLEFELGGQHFHWDADVQDDYADPNILSRFAELLESRGTGRRYCYIHDDTGILGQCSIIGCSTPDQLALLREKTRLDWRWLD